MNTFYKVVSTILFAFLPFTLQAFDHNHSLWDKILKEHTKVTGKQILFNYKNLKSSQEEFSKYLEELSSLKLDKFNTFNSEQKLAFWINAYNAFTVKLIIDNYPVKSIKDLGSLFSSPWKKEFFSLLGKKMSLDQIEHETIRKNFKEPRIHFAVNCASLGCPSLLREAFTYQKLEQQLNSATHHFLGNQSKNQLKLVKNTIYISKIFKWYSGDFVKSHGSVLKFIKNALKSDPVVTKSLSLKNIDIEYTDYDWNLNEWK